MPCSRFWFGHVLAFIALSTIFHQRCTALCLSTLGVPFLHSRQATSATGRRRPFRLSMKLGGGGGEKAEQAQEALSSLGDFHQGSWKGKTTSFTVTADVAAGIVQKKTSPDYQVDIKLSYNPQGTLSIAEVYSWQKKQTTDNQQDDLLSYASTRSVSIADSSVDIDAVDASYSLHQQYSNADNDEQQEQRPQQQQSTEQLPVDLIGTEKVVEFAVEHCIAVSDDERVRLWALYGEKQDLIRVVVGDEKRVPTESTPSFATEGGTLTATDLLELQSDVDRIVDKIAGQVQGITPDQKNSDNHKETNDDGDSKTAASSLKDIEDRVQSAQSMFPPMASSSSSTSSKEDRGPPLSRYPMSLLELTSGVWLGDSVIRDFSHVPGEIGSINNREGGGKGFGGKSVPANTNQNKKPPPFGSWAVGVQKVAREWLWDFGEVIRQNNSAGKCLGFEMEPALSQSMAGAVCENQSLSRRIPKEERMVYIDWNDGNGDNHVGFLLGSVSIQVPRYMTFNSRQTKPFYTELCVYQSAATGDDQAGTPNPMAAGIAIPDDASVIELPEVICSRICRLYDSEGLLKQGCTSFYSLRRFGPDMDSEAR